MQIGSEKAEEECISQNDGKVNVKYRIWTPSDAALHILVEEVQKYIYRRK